jgi:hypothetical protein
VVSWQENGGFDEKRLSIVTNPNHRLLLLISFFEGKTIQKYWGSHNFQGIPSLI